MNLSSKVNIQESRYRLKTESEFKHENRWNYRYGMPMGWNADGLMNQYMGAVLDKDYNTPCEKKLEIKNTEGWRFFPTDYVEIKTNKLSRFRFKTEAEFKAENQWNTKTNRPYGWESKVIHLLGQDIPTVYNMKCQVSTAIHYAGVVFNQTDYTEITLEDIIKNMIPSSSFSIPSTVRKISLFDKIILGFLCALTFGLLFAVIFLRK